MHRAVVIVRPAKGGWLRRTLPLLATAGVCLAAAGAARADGPMATAMPAPAAPSQPSLESILPQARTIMAQNESTWDKATAIRDLVRASLPTSDDCGIMATAFWSVGAIVGLPVRIVVLSANARNLFDTHSTVEVWLANRGSWAISDPTFNGFWTYGTEGAPLSVGDIRQAVADGKADQLAWHGAGTANSIEPSAYYVDPLALFRYSEILATVNGGHGGLVADAADGFYSSRLYVPLSPTDFESLPPDAQVPVTVTADVTNATLGATDFQAPPTYANQLVYDQTLPVAQGQVAISGAPLAGPGVLEVGTGEGTWKLAAAWATYALDGWAHAHSSPIVQMAPTMRLDVTGSDPADVEVRIWSVKEFPAARQTSSQWTEPRATIESPTAAATDVRATTSRVSAGVVTSGAPGQAYVDFGPTAAYGQTADPVPVASGAGTWSPSVALSGLAPETTYHWRLRFVDAEGVVATGTDQTFRTLAAPPPEIVPTPTVSAPAAPDEAPLPLPAAAVRSAARSAASALRRAVLARDGRTLSLAVAVPIGGLWSFELRSGARTLARGTAGLELGRRAVRLGLTRSGIAAINRSRALHVTIRAAYPSAQGSTSSTISTTWLPGSLRPASRRNGTGTRTP